jgi:hypothetical protein
MGNPTQEENIKEPLKVTEGEESHWFKLADFMNYGPNKMKQFT